MIVSVNRNWIEIVIIWMAVAISSILILLGPNSSAQSVEASFGALLAGALASVSAIALFRQKAEGFVRRLIYVAGGSYLILAIATIFVIVRG